MILDMARVQYLISNDNGMACGGNWNQMLYTIYRDLVGTEKAEHAWDLQKEVGMNGFDEFEYWATLIGCICYEILELIGDYKDDGEDWDWNDGYEFNRPCDTYGPLACDTSCPDYFKCNK